MIINKFNCLDETYLEVAGGVQEEVGGLEISMEDIGRVDVLQASEDLVQKVADVIVAQLLQISKEYINTNHYRSC